MTGIITGRGFTLIGGKVNFICVGGREGVVTKKRKVSDANVYIKEIGLN